MRPLFPSGAFGLLLASGACTLLMPHIAQAGNGLNDIGYGAESGGMAGADLATTSDPSALNINPAGLASIKRRAFNFGIEPFYFMDTRHRDQFGNDQKLANPFGLLFSGAYAQRLASTPVVAGIGLFVQGGGGFSYQDLNTAFGTQDDISASFGSFKLEPGFAWSVSEKLSLGASLGLVYSQARAKFFTETSYAGTEGAEPFFGFRLDGVSGWSTSGKIGFQYQLADNWMIAGAYTSKTPIRLKGGTATFNYEDIGQGRVVYNDVSLTGLSLAQEAGIGVSFRPTRSWLVAAEINWLDWKNALSEATLHASDPDNQQVPQVLELISNLDWRDQYVLAAGVAYRWSDHTTIRLGYNYGRNPIPKETTNPVLAATSSRTYSFGFSQYFGEQWDLSGCVYYQPAVKTTYTNVQLPFGVSTYNRLESIAAQITVTRRW